MMFLLAAVGVGVAALLPRLRASATASSPDQVWDHFLVATGMRPVPVTMRDVRAVAELADVPTTLLDRVALGRTGGNLAMVAPLTNGRVLVAVRRDGPAASSPGLVVRGGWHIDLRPGPAEDAWATSPARGTPSRADG